MFVKVVFVVFVELPEDAFAVLLVVEFPNNYVMLSNFVFES